jgi:hypothetical protein
LLSASKLDTGLQDSFCATAFARPTARRRDAPRNASHATMTEQGTLLFPSNASFTNPSVYASNWIPTKPRRPCLRGDRG